jgi:hypothetical protein
MTLSSRLQTSEVSQTSDFRSLADFGSLKSSSHHNKQAAWWYRRDRCVKHTHRTFELRMILSGFAWKSQPHRRCGKPAGPFQLGGKLPFDKLRANEKACPFALSLSKGEFAPQLKNAPASRVD